MKLDETNVTIIQHLKEGRKPFKLIADELGVAENTVRSRVAKMTEEGVLDITGLVNPESIHGKKMAYVGVKLKDMDLVKKGAEFSKLKSVVHTSVVTGRFDLMLLVMLDEEHDLLEFYTDEISHIKGVLSIETFVIYKSYDMKVPYIF
ncbi:MAG: Lrp/AsnC family transcriptional regulator [Desulfobacterales bacterium]|nr:Lrp/AsnC family transcriptional regulator [Desulfobacterales bacterium]